MKIIYTWHDLGRYAKNAAKSLLRGLIRLVWLIILLVINIIATALNLEKCNQKEAVSIRAGHIRCNAPFYRCGSHANESEANNG